MLKIVPDIVLCDKMTSKRMQAARPETRHEEVHKHGLATGKELDDENVEHQLNHYADDVPIRHFLRPHEAWP